MFVKMLIFKLMSSSLNANIGRSLTASVIRTRHFQAQNLTARDITQPSHGESGTLQARFIKYIALENAKFDQIIPKDVKYSKYYPLSNVSDFEKVLGKTNQDQLPYVSILTSTFKTNADPWDVANVITTIDNVCCEKLHNMSDEDIFRNLYSFMYLIPNKITKLKFYKSSIKVAIENFNSTKTKEMFVQLCYYLGLSKNNYESSYLMKTFLSEFSEIYLEQLNTTDFAIITNAAYKSSTPFDLTTYHDRLVYEICNKDLDNDLLITFVKSLRFNRIKSNEVIKQLELEIKNNSRKFDFKGLCHIFALFAENNYNEEETCQKLVDLGREILQSVNPYDFVFNDVRPKDLSTFLWSCAQLKFSTLHEDDFNYFENIIVEKLDRNEYEKCSDELIDTCLSLWMLNYKSYNLLGQILEKRSSDSIVIKQPKNQRVKLESRFKLLINLIQLDSTENIVPKQLKSRPFDEYRPAPDFLLKNNVSLNNIYNLISENQSDLKVKNIKIVQPILELNVPGLLIEYGDEKLFLEILDKNNKLRFNNEPNAFISLKITTLQNLKQKVLLVDAEDETTNILEKIRKYIN